jgi:anti-sigma B factor antagonist
MNINTRNVGEILTIDIDGRLDTQTSTSALEALLVFLQTSPKKILISLALLEFVSSSGLRVILRVAKEVRGYGGEFKVCGANGVVKEVLEISGFDSLLDLYEDETHAVESFE